MRVIENLKVLEENDFKRFAPSVLAEGPAETVSDKYCFANTHKVVTDLENLNWFPVFAKENRIINKNYGGFQKHMIKFRSPQHPKTIDGLWPEIYLTNSHNAKASFQLRAGIFRLVCSNGMVAGQDMMPELRIRHLNYDFTEASKAIGTIAESLPFMMTLIEKMKNTSLNSLQMEKMTEMAFKLRWPKEKPLNSDYRSLSRANRGQDQGNDLWSFFNVLQENTIKGKWYREKQNKEGKRYSTKVRQINSIDQTVKINSHLWDIAQNYILN